MNVDSAGGAAAAAASNNDASTTTASASAPPPPPRHQTDVRKRTVLPKTLQNMQASAGGQASSEASGLTSLLGLPADEYLDRMEEELNRRVDQDTETLVEGMADLVKMANVSSDEPDYSRICQGTNMCVSVIHTDQGQRSLQSFARLVSSFGQV